MNKEYEVGNRGPDEIIHDILYHIEIKRKYIYIWCETGQFIWPYVAKIPKSDVKDPDNITFEQAHKLYINGR